MAAPLARAPSSPSLLGGLFVMGVIVNICAAAINTHVFVWAAPIAVAWMRQAIAAAVLTGIAVASGQRRPRASRTALWAIAWAASLALNSSAYYLSVARLPLGTATTLSFVGPVVVAATGTRRRRDLVWVACAALGVIAIAQPRAAGFDGPGVAIALAGSVGWALFLLCGSRVVRVWGPAVGAACTSIGSALLLAPFMVVAGGFPFTNARATGILLVTATLGAAVPYTIDTRVMQRLAPATFGVLQSLFPAVGVLVGLATLGQVPDVFEVAGVALVTAASIGALQAAARAGAIAGATP